MDTVRVAWRLRCLAIQASLLPFAVMFALHYVETELLLASSTPDLLYMVTDVLHFALEALILGMLLEASLSAGGPPSWRLVVIPSVRAVSFAAAMAPIGLAALLMQRGLGTWLTSRYAEMLAVNPDAPPGPLLILLGEAAFSPAPTWLPAGLFVAPIAVAILRPTRFKARPRSLPDLSFLVTLLVAVVLSTAFETGMVAAPGRVPGLQEVPLLAELGANVAWYTGRTFMLAVIAAGVGVMLVRRAGQPAEA
jgi:hypothetical protein